MGEKIRDISHFKGIDIEYNKEAYMGGPKTIHIQNCLGRFSVNETDFIQMCCLIKKAKKILAYTKKWDENDD